MCGTWSTKCESEDAKCAPFASGKSLSGNRGVLDHEVVVARHSPFKAKRLNSGGKNYNHGYTYYYKDKRTQNKG